jgi:hypothetical protein
LGINQDESNQPSNNDFVAHIVVHLSEGNLQLDNKSRTTITIMSSVFALSVLSLFRNGEEEINHLTVQLCIFSAASVAAVIARAFFNKGIQHTQDEEVQLSLPSGWQFFKFLSAFFLSSLLFLFTAFLFVHKSLELGILIIVNCLIGVPVAIVAGLLTFKITGHHK